MTSLSVWAALVSGSGRAIMPKYRFSQGKVWVEEGIYRPFLNRNQQEGYSTVLLISRNGLPASVEPSTFVQEERRDAHPESSPITQPYTAEPPEEPRPDLSA
jgi:hypothetical protein